MVDSRRSFQLINGPEGTFTAKPVGLLLPKMKKRGEKKVVNEDIFEFMGQKYDTVLLMMNGIGVVGTLSKFEKFLSHLKNLLHKNGQVAFDSSDIRYLYKKQNCRPITIMEKSIISSRTKKGSGLIGFILARNCW